MLPALQGADKDPIRPYILQQGFGKQYLAIRRGDWKYMAHKGSGGNRYNEKSEMRDYVLPELDPDAPGQLYNLASDPGEKVNLYNKNPEITKELSELLKKTIAEGRSAPAVVSEK